MDFLPDEIFEYICRHLAVRDLKSMMLVNNYSKFVIEHSPVLMNNLPIYLTDIETDEFGGEDERKLEPLMYSQRKVRKVIIELKKEKIMKYLGIFQNFGHSIRTLEIKSYVFETIDQLRIILRFLLKLNTLIVSKVTFQRDENKILNSIVQVPKLSLRELRNVICVNSDPKIFSLFNGIHQNIYLRTIRLYVSDTSNFHYYDFVETMNQQTSLKQLVLNGITTDNCDIFDYDHLAVSQLDTLEIESCVISLRQQMKNLMQLIKNQRKLNMLKILNTSFPTTFDIMVTYRQMFAHNINELHLDIRDLSVFHSHHFANRTITKLVLHGNFAFENLPVFINFIKMFPNIVRLSLIGDVPIGDKYLFHILSTFKKLKELHVPGFTSRAADSNFSNLSTLDSELHTLELEFIDFDIKFFGWKNIVSNLRQIEKLIVRRDYGRVSNEIIDVIIKNLKLKHLELGIGVVSEKILQNIVNNNYCDQLKVLKIAKIDFEKIQEKFIFSQIFERNHLLLYSCENQYFYPIKLIDKANTY